MTDPSPRWVTAIDVVLVPDLSLIRRAVALNARLTKASNEPVSLDSAYRLHLTTLQCYVRTAALQDVYAELGSVLRSAHPGAWELSAIGCEAVERNGVGTARLRVGATEAWRRMQADLIDALAPHSETCGASEAFAESGDGAEIDEATIASVAAFVPHATGERFEPYVDLGRGRPEEVRALASEPFEPITFRASGAALYQLGADAASRVRLKWWVFPVEEDGVSPVTRSNARTQFRARQGAQTFRQISRLPEQ